MHESNRLYHYVFHRTAQNMNHPFSPKHVHMKVNMLVNSEESSESVSNTEKPLEALQGLLEDIYLDTPHPSTAVLQGLLRTYHAIPSMIYLRSWFNNRHNKQKRSLCGERRTKAHSLLKYTASYMVQDNGAIVDLNRPGISRDHFGALLFEMQQILQSLTEYDNILLQLQHLE